MSYCPRHAALTRSPIHGWLFALAFCVVVLAARAQDTKLDHSAGSPYIIDNWNTAKGLPSNSLLSLFQSTDGFIWISSYQGLLRFDGSEFIHYSKSNTPSFQTSGVSTIDQDKNGILWFGTYGGGMLNFSNSTFHSSPKELRDFTVGALYADGPNLLVGTRGHGLFCYRGDSLISTPELEPLKDMMISAIVRDAKGALWIGTENLGLFKIVNGTVKNFTTTDGLPENKIASLQTDKKNRLWIGTGKGMAFVLNDVIATDKTMPDCLVKNIAHDARGNLWAASNCGLFIKEDNQLAWHEFLGNNNKQLASNIVDVLPSREGDLWISTYRQGLFRIRYSSFYTLSTQNGIRSPIITSIAEVGSNEFLIGSDNGTVDRVIDGFVTPLKTRTKIPETRIRHIIKDTRKNIWIGTSAGLLKITPAGKEEWLTKDSGLSDNQVRVLFEDQQGTIWIGTRAGGITKIDKEGGFSYLNKQNGFPSDFIMSIDQDHAGTMWIGSNESGLVKLSNDQIQVYTTKDGLPTNVIFNVYEDGEGILWIATNSGLVRFANGNFFTFDGSRGLPNESPYDVLEDTQHNLWIPTSVGLMKIRKENLTAAVADKEKAVDVRIYDHQDGIEEPECTGTTTSVKSSNGSMWIPTLNGVIILDPHKLPVNEDNVSVYINSLVVNDQRFSPTENIEIKPGVKRFSIVFSALNLRAPAKVKFRFKLENFDSQWFDVGTRREVFFTNLRPGSYRFLVMAKNEDGKWSSKTAELRFTLLPEFYQTPFFYFLIALGLTVFLIAVFRWRVYSMRLRNDELSKQVSKQTEELRSINAALAEQKEEVERANEELLAQHNFLADANNRLEEAHIGIKQANEQLIQSNQWLEEKVNERTKDLQTALDKVNKLNEELAVFIYRASHDLKGPTASLIGLALLGKMEGDNESKRYFDRIENTAGRMNKVLSKLINVHGAITRKDLNPEQVVIAPLVEDAWQTSIGNFPEKVSFTLDCTIHQTINTDATLLKIVLENLFENALIFRSPDRQLIVLCRIERTNDTSVMISVEDNGIGIEEESLARVFDLFYRASENSKGNGLGLYLVKKAVEKLGGEITLQSVPRKFSRFNIIFSECTETVPVRSEF